MQDARLFLNTPLLPIQTQRETVRKETPQGKVPYDTDFASILNQKKGEVIFSQHALERVRSRGIDFTDADLKKLDDIVSKMADKGARESLVYMNGVALVVSVKNRTVITAMEGNSVKQNVFTNIDSAAIL